MTYILNFSPQLPNPSLTSRIVDFKNFLNSIIRASNATFAISNAQMMSSSGSCNYQTKRTQNDCNCLFLSDTNCLDCASLFWSSASTTPQLDKYLATAARLVTGNSMIFVLLIGPSSYDGSVSSSFHFSVFKHLYVDVEYEKCWE